MVRTPPVPVLAALLAALAAAPLGAQDPVRDSVFPGSMGADSARREAEPRDSAERGDEVPDAEMLRLAAAFFAERAPLELELKTNLGALRRQRGDDNPWREARLAYALPGGDSATFGARLRTRGIFRLKLCDFPPLRVRLGRRAREGTVLEGLRRPKLVTYCKDRDEFEQYVLQEYMIYRMYEALTPFALRARLLRVTYTDSATARRVTTRYGILLEEEEQIAARLDGQILEAHGAQPHHLDAYQSALHAVFQFMIGNTDWSVGGLHNVFLVQTTLDVHPVAYDFDFAGIVKARYAAPDPRMGIKQVTERVYRGTCATVDEIPHVLELFRARRDSVYAAIAGTPGLTERNAKRVRDYIDEFYELIAEPNRVRREIVQRCIKVN
jgi:hypothetical protein